MTGELASRLLEYRVKKNSLDRGKLLLPCRCRLLRRESDSDRKSTRLNSSHGYISYAVFCLENNLRERRRLRRPKSNMCLERCATNATVMTGRLLELCFVQATKMGEQIRAKAIAEGQRPSRA